MANEQQVVRSVSWSEVFGFSFIFKSFALAKQPTKLVLALAAIALTWALGMFVLDPGYSALTNRGAVQKDEAWQAWAAPSRTAFLESRELWLKETRPTRLATLLTPHPDLVKEPAKAAREEFRPSLQKLVGQYESRYRADQAAAQARYAEALKLLQPQELKDSEARLMKERQAAERAAAQQYLGALGDLAEIRGLGVFEAFWGWEEHCMRKALDAILHLRLTSGTLELLTSRGSLMPKSYGALETTNVPPPAGQVKMQEDYGLVAWLVLMAWGAWWMISTYPIYAVVYLLLALAVWVIFGGAICRMAALQAARDERASWSQALRFSLSRFFSMLTAPLLPAAAIVGLGLLLALGGLFSTIQYVDMLFAVTFFIALALGAVIALLAIGLAGGVTLMWPTIAVEGSDSFDAMSRSYCYAYTQPFRFGFYWLVAAVYGALCYLFVRLVAYAMLAATHCWVGWGMGAQWGIFHGDRSSYGPGAGKLDLLWTPPTFTNLVGPMQVELMTGWERAVAYVIQFWAYAVSGVVLAFLVSFLFSAATCVYYLLRRQVDATDLDDVYVEDEEEMPGAAPAPAGAAASEPSVPPPAEPGPAAGQEKP